MSPRIVVEPEAEAELQAAAEWYEAQEAGLGFELLEQAEAAYRAIAQGRRGTPVPHVRIQASRFPIARFPLWIVFLDEKDTVRIIAYALERRRPGYWLSRGRTS